VAVNIDVTVEFSDYIDTLTSFDGPRTCAACEMLKDREYVPCICGTSGDCGNCGWGRPCSEEFPLPNCPRERFTMRLEPPKVLLRSKSLGDVLKKNRSEPESTAGDLDRRLDLVREKMRQVDKLEKQVEGIRSRTGVH